MPCCRRRTKSGIQSTEFLYRHCDLPVDCQDIYIYGSELFLSTSLSIISMLLISLVAGKPISGILFVLIFVGLRVFVGGFHAATYGTCFLLTNGVFLTAFLSSILLEKCGSPQHHKHKEICRIVGKSP